MKIIFKELKKPWLGKYSGITLIPFVLVYYGNKTKRQIAELKNHELIHAAQVQDEMDKWTKRLYIKLLGSIAGWVSWYCKYLCEWIGNVFRGYFSIKGMSTRQAYMNISAEREAYANDSNLDYLKTRKPFAQKDYKL